MPNAKVTSHGRTARDVRKTTRVHATSLCRMVRGGKDFWLAPWLAFAGNGSRGCGEKRIYTIFLNFFFLFADSFQRSMDGSTNVERKRRQTHSDDKWVKRIGFCKELRAEKVGLQATMRKVFACDSQAAELPGGTPSYTGKGCNQHRRMASLAFNLLGSPLLETPFQLSDPTNKHDF